MFLYLGQNRKQEMGEPKFSIVAIAKNEANTLPRLFESIREFLNRGGEFVLLDTGSTDKTVEIAKNNGAKVFEVGEKFISVIDRDTAKRINEAFIVEGETPIVFEGNRLFNFAAARNHVSSLASNDFVVTMDCDEAYSVLNIDKVNEAIENGHDQLEYQFVFAHDPTGRPVIQFVQSKAFDRRNVKWNGIVHEVLSGATNIKYLDESIIKLEHWQEQGKEHRGNYLVGLALDCLNNPNNDRNSHYLAREMGWTNRPKSAIKEFERHIAMGGWEAERAQSMIHISECYGKLNDSDSQIQWLTKAYALDSRRREALIQLAFVFRHRNNPYACAAYAAAALQLPWVDYYANNRDFYEHIPHELLYQSLGIIGNVQGAKHHLWEALKYQPYNERYLYDTRFFFEYPSSMIQGWMTYEEQLCLYEESKKHHTIVEVGSWKGRSSIALLTGNKGKVYCVDTWRGSADVMDLTNAMAKQEDVFEVFKENTKEFSNLNIIRKPSIEAAKDFEDESIDFCFIDAGHSYEECKADALAWSCKVKKGGTIAFHDYQPDIWMGVVKCIDELYGKPDELHGSIAIVRKR